MALAATNIRPFPNRFKVHPNYMTSSGKQRQLCALIVDDNPGDRKLIAFHLENASSANVTVTEVDSLKDAFDAIEALRFDVVFLDLGLPESTGPETVSQFTTLAPDVPVVVVTGHEDETVGLESIARGAQEFIAKQNLNAAGVSAAMRHAIERHKLYRQMEVMIADNPEPILIVDFDGVTRFANKAAAKLYQKHQSELVDQPFDMNVHDLKEGEHLIWHNDEEFIVAEVNIKPTLWAGAQSFLITLHDISERKKQEERLVLEKEQAVADMKAKDKFLANMSHELRTPLNSVLGFAELILERSNGPINNDIYRDYISIIHESGRALNDQINDLLELSKLGSDETELIADGVDLAGIVKSLKEEMQPDAEKAGLTLEFDTKDKDLLVDGDSKRLRKLFRHLISNAIKFTEREGSINVSFTDAGKYLLCMVSDTGCGIDKQNIDRVFEPFVRVEDHLSRKVQQGTGIGLTLARQIARLHGGELSIESARNVGTTVITRLPKLQEN